MKYLTCIECGKQGHIKCTNEAQSQLIKIDGRVMNDLNEYLFFQLNQILPQIVVWADNNKRNWVNIILYVRCVFGMLIGLLLL